MGLTPSCSEHGGRRGGDALLSLQSQALAASAFADVADALWFRRLRFVCPTEADTDYEIAAFAMWLVICACVTALPFLTASAFAGGQVQNGEIFGKVTDTSGAVLPGVTVTIDSPSLLKTQSVTITETGVSPPPACRSASTP